MNRCPGRAIPRDKVWWRGIERNKLIYDRCRPVMVTYHGCAVCMIVCPIQKYGMKPVMEHYVETGEVLGKDSENLEGYALKGKDTLEPVNCRSSIETSSSSPTGVRRTGCLRSSRRG